LLQTKPNWVLIRHYNGQEQVIISLHHIHAPNEAQDCLNEELLDDGQAARILGDLNAHVVFNRAAINHINSFTRDDLLDKKNRSMVNF
jgi:hypothetical protein